MNSGSPFGPVLDPVQVAFERFSPMRNDVTADGWLEGVFRLAVYPACGKCHAVKGSMCSVSGGGFHLVRLESLHERGLIGDKDLLRLRELADVMQVVRLPGSGDGTGS